jgi:hypothetical protein
MTAAPKTLQSRKTVNAAVIAGAAPCSEFEVSVLKVLAGSRGNVNAAWLAAKMWPEAKGKYFGARSGRWQRAGAVLHRLNRLGLVWRSVTEYNQKLWTISPAGQRVAETPNARHEPPPDKTL